jgi:hypothetical protein
MAGGGCTAGQEPGMLPGENRRRLGCVIGNDAPPGLMTGQTRSDLPTLQGRAEASGAIASTVTFAKPLQRHPVATKPRRRTTVDLSTTAT